MRADLVVVGGGPRALQALLALDDALAAAEERGQGLGRELVVDLFEPGRPGAGAVWCPDQLPHLLMNLDPSSVDFRSRSGTVSHDYRAWERCVRYVPLRYPPRARMGLYLVWVFGCVERSPRLRIRHRREAVTGLVRGREGWDVLTEGGAARTVAPRVVLATGHAGGGAVDHTELAADVARRGPGAHVAVRGAALTGIDTVLTLTAARGSRWFADGSPEPEQAPVPIGSGLTWVPSGQEPDRITLVSRSGELLMPKPDVLDPAVVEAVRSVTSRWRPGAVPDDGWWDVLVDAAAAAAHASGRRFVRDSAHVVLARGRDEEPWQERWLRDLDRAEGNHPCASSTTSFDEAAWWLGRAWAAGYAHVVASLDRSVRPEHEWRRWRERAARLERWAFGPPAETVRKLLALGEAGMLDVARSVPAEATVEVDAITRGPGVLDDHLGADGAEPRAHDSLWATLLDLGQVQVRPGERGVLTTASGQCISPEGRGTPGLSVLGRPTEDPVIGHDTLLRLHADVERWAERIAAEMVAGRAVMPRQRGAKLRTAAAGAATAAVGEA
ncbi:FAD/NAD(P)-binding protein [Nocardioides yefusunii]|uniref:FAD/NAD(P)-binding protein n=1 Tax=Nocardioides yefusunii TaxID=2500546 RepID=A0ABW1QTJ0_9ACTN|nr:FAD/NAD(P)-binding protein [Nocardioides yefusunii]